MLAEIVTYITLAREGLGMLKELRELMPKGPKRDEIEQKLKRAEEALQRSDAQLAKQLGYDLCECTFPPQIMLWREQEKACVCPNPACGRRESYWNGSGAAEDYDPLGDFR